MPPDPLIACDYHTSVLMSTPNNFYPHTPMYCDITVISSIHSPLHGDKRKGEYMH